jgi:hypothetical protein
MAEDTKRKGLLEDRKRTSPPLAQNSPRDERVWGYSDLPFHESVEAMQGRPPVFPRGKGPHFALRET